MPGSALIEPVTDRKLIQIGPARITEPLHVNDHDRAMNRVLQLTHRASPLIGTTGRAIRRSPRRIAW